MSVQHHSTHRIKTELFCQSCGHASPIDGDWVADDSTPRYRLCCPRCDGVVVDRPRP
jgi:uncharacterized protein YbaR (Trm112 family)